MSEILPTDELRRLADASAEMLLDDYSLQDVVDARALLKKLRDRREFDKLITLVEALSRIEPDDPATRRLYAQALIERGRATVAVDVLRAIIARLPQNDPEAYEAQGLLGRAFKQMFIDARIKGSEAARRAMADAIEAYRKLYEDNPPPLWHGVNLLALLDNCRRRGVPITVPYEPRALATRLLTQLEQVPVKDRDEWYLATVAEASLGTRDWAVIEEKLRQYVLAPGVQEFHLNSTLRQLTEIWDLAASARGKAVIEILRARLLELQNSVVVLAPHEVNESAGDKSTYEAILGKDGAKTLVWWRTGLERARSVAAIRQKLAHRFGTGFLVRAGDLGRQPADELLVLTNFHVANAGGLRGGLTAEQAEVVFEADDPERRYDVAEILWESSEDECDAALLRLAGPAPAIQPMPVAKALPMLEGTGRVYVIGHPGARELAFSLQDNELIDHEGPLAGKPAIPGVVRVHYRAPTEGGSSGSPVFNGSAWEVIALHHKGGMLGMPRLNGVAGTYAANEGIWLRSIIEKMKQ
ncbi:MAG: serine protease [Gammaproteobacteria bacterium]